MDPVVLQLSASRSPLGDLGTSAHERLHRHHCRLGLKPKLELFHHLDQSLQKTQEPDHQGVVLAATAVPDHLPVVLTATAGPDHLPVVLSATRPDHLRVVLVAMLCPITSR